MDSQDHGIHSCKECMPKGSVQCYDKEIEEEKYIFKWSPRIMGFIHSRNVCQNKVITINRLREECTQEESLLVIREEKMGATEYQAFMIQRISLKQ